MATEEHGRARGQGLTWLLAAASMAVMAACGGGEKPGAGETAAAPAPPAGGAAPAGAAGTTTGAAPAASGAAITGRTVDVKMVLDGSNYRFDPANVTIHPGDGVRWTMVSGGPHNVSFWADSIPAGAQGTLQANMPNTTAPLIGPLLVNANDTYTVSFAGAAPGVYKYYCTPHLAMGMKAQVTVQ